MTQLPVYNVKFQGYKLDRDVDNMPDESGVYMIYRCLYNKNTDTVSLQELIYIGKATSLHQEVCYHKRRSEFLAQAREGESLCYAYAKVSRVQYDVVENALIYMQKPRLNDNLKDNYNHQDAEFHFLDRCRLLDYTNFKIIDGEIIPL